MTGTEPKRRSRVEVTGWRARGRALMRIGPAFPVAVAIARLAPAGIHSDGLAEGAARPGQHPGQLAQTPERSPPPTGQVGPENPPATAPPAAAPPHPSPGTPATVLDDQEVSTILGKSVRRSADDDFRP